MDVERQDQDAIWPPGTVKLEDLRAGTDGEIILQPRPSSDPNDPLNWPKWRKYLNFGLSSYYAVMVYALIDAATPTWSPMNEQLGFSYDILNDSYAIGCGTLAIGAFLLIPFALKFGRRPVYILSTAVQFAISIWSAKLQTVTDLMLVNVFSCLVGALAEVIVQMTVADVFFVHQRGLMNRWRWVWWWIALFFGLGLICFIFLYEESKYTLRAIDGIAVDEVHRPIDGNETREKEQTFKTQLTTQATETGTNQELQPRSNSASVDTTIPMKTYWQRLSLWSSSPGSLHSFVRHSYQPFMILISIPAVFYMSLLYGAMLAASTVMVTTLSSWMAAPPYNFNAAQIGLMSLPPWIGTTLGSLVCGPMSDWLILFLAKRNKGIYEPEMRLWVIAAFIPFVPAGLFMFGIGLNNGSPWPVLAVGYALCNFGTTPASSIALTYITDAYTEIVADALVAVTFTRNLLSTIFVFVLLPWIAKVGMKNVYVTIGVLLTAVLLGTFIFILYGKMFRVKTAHVYRYYAARQFESRRI
ncbi:hypothetical protein DTO169E5_8041 [Paecilomyces variotii]|nr:hypothetical protein DTO169E5_8041 [Paecilomyces variotii]KAJ9258157.1 hypothetical protein DTO195F2_5382 [Paecilomyces variotii]